MQFLILFLFLLMMIVVGIISSRGIKNADDYVLGGRRMGPWLSSFSYGTAYFSAVIFVGYAGRFGWSFGVSATWIGIGNAIIGSLLAWLLLAERTRSISQAMNISTMSEFFRKRYDSPALEKFSAMIIFIFLIPYSASVYQGLGQILTRFFYGTVLADIRLSMLLMAVITAVYLFFGGYVSTAVNSLIQGLIMFVGVIFMVGRVITMAGGLDTAFTHLASVQTDAVPAGSLTGLAGPAPFDLLVLVLMTSLGTFGLPQMIGKFKGIRDKKSVKRATIMSTFFALVIGGGAYFIGGLSRALDHSLGLNFAGMNLDELMPLLFEAILTPEMMAVLVVLMLSASMSTLAAVVLVSAPTFTKTVLKSNRMIVLRSMSMVFVLVSYMVAIIPSAIVTLMAFSWGAVSGAFIGPYIWGLFLKKLTKASALIGMVSGLSVVIIGAAAALIVNPATASAWAPRLAVLAIFTSLVVTPVASLLTKNISRIPAGAAYLDKAAVLSLPQTPPEELKDAEAVPAVSKRKTASRKVPAAADISGD